MAIVKKVSFGLTIQKGKNYRMKNLYKRNWKTCICVISLIVAIAACSMVDRPKPTPSHLTTFSPTAASFPSPTIYSPLIVMTAITPGITPLPSTVIPPSQTTTLTPLPTQLELTWADGIRPLIFSDYNGLNNVSSWSPIANEILLLDCDSGKSNIAKVAAPDFTTVILSKQSACTDASWSPDGKSIAFVDTENNIRIVRWNGSVSRRVNATESLMFPMVPGWIDPQNLIYWSYSGGGHGTYIIVDIVTGEEQIIASVPGGIETPNAGYIPITYEPDPQVFRLLVLSMKFPISDTPVPMFFADGHYLPFPEFNSVSADQTIAEFNGWYAGTNQILVAWKYYTKPEWEIQKEYMLLWDVGANEVTAIAPNGIRGFFSSDGRYLAYNTRGPAKLDKDNIPVDNDSPYHIKLYDEPIEYTTYMQVLEMASKKVSLSLPSWDMNFSPNGRYLAFRTSGALQLDNSKWPVGIIQGEKKVDCTNIIDLWAGELIVSLKDVSTLPVWAPDNDRFLYRDAKGNIYLYSIGGSNSIVVTQSMGRYEIRQMDWSYDGQYFLIRMTHRQRDLYYYDVAIVKAP